MRWSRLTLPIDMDGMGFRDLCDFNTTMLTKMAWRLQDDQTSLWTWVLKGLYFPRGELMNANKGARLS